MTWRKGHGVMKDGGPRIETLPADELPKGIPAPARQENPGDRDRRGLFQPGNSLARVAGKAKKGSTHLGGRFSLKALPQGSDFERYKTAAIPFARAIRGEYAMKVGGGECGPAASSIIASAARALALSMYFGDKAMEAGDADLAMKAVRMADSHKQCLQSAYEICQRMAEASEKKAPSAHSSLVAALSAEEGEDHG